MTKKDAYIWYSGATDVTGKKLAEELGIDGDKDAPKGKKIVIGWGTKTDEDVNFPAGTITLNHPNCIRANRNKLTTLKVLMNTIINGRTVVALFTEANKVMQELDKKNPTITLPLVGRTKFHQGGKGFWLCITKTHVKNAIEEGAQYFQEYIDIVDEYRIHVFKGALLHAQKKVKRDDMEKAFVEQRKEKIHEYAKKAEKKLDEDTLDYALARIAKEHEHVDMIVRSNKRGWKFSTVKNVGKELLDVAIGALKAAGLEFGAVDCCLDSDGKPWVIEVNSGPGLEGTTFKAYIDAFNNELQNILQPVKKVEPKQVIKNKKEVGFFAVGAEAKGGKSKLGANSAKERLSGVRELLDLIEGADEAEAAAVEKLLKKRLAAGA